MDIRITDPSAIDAELVAGTDGAWQLNFYKSRKHANAHLIETVSQGGTVLGRYLIRVAPNGSVSLENLGDTFEPESDQPTNSNS